MRCAVTAGSGCRRVVWCDLGNGLDSRNRASHRRRGSGRQQRHGDGGAGPPIDHIAERPQDRREIIASAAT
jgi:hypothetical protein